MRPSLMDTYYRGELGVMRVGLDISDNMLPVVFA